MNATTRRAGVAGALLCAAALGCAPHGGGQAGGDGGRGGGGTYDVDANGVPRFVDTSYIDLDGLTRISLFRSHDGHDYSDGVETCRSMKHYFKVPTSATVIRAPVATRDALAISRAQRDAAPLLCSGETFTNAADDPYPVDVAF